MGIHGTCKACGGNTEDYVCRDCQATEIEQLKGEVKRLHAIDAILKDAGGTCAPNAVEDEEGGVVAIYVGSFAEAVQLNDLLYGGDGKVTVEGREESSEPT